MVKISNVYVGGECIFVHSDGAEITDSCHAMHYFVAVLTIAISLVHEGLAPHFLPPLMLQALLSDQPFTVPLQDAYNHEVNLLLDLW